MEESGIGAEFQILRRNVIELICSPTPKASIRAKRLKTVLERNEHLFGDPLRPQERGHRPSGAEGKSVEEELGSKLDVSPEIVKALLSAAKNVEHRYEMPLFATAEMIYFAERHHFLQTLLTIIKLAGDTSKPSELYECGAAFLFRLHRKFCLGFKLLKLLLDLTDRAQNSEAFRTYYVAERQLVADCLFYTYYNVMPTRPYTEVFDMIEYVKKLTTFLEAQPNDAELYQVIYIIVLTLVNILEPDQHFLSDDKINSESFKDSAGRDPQFLLQFSQRIDPTQSPTSPFLSIVGIAWVLFLHELGYVPSDSDPLHYADTSSNTLILRVYKDLLKFTGAPSLSNPFKLLNDILGSATFAQDSENIPVFIGVIDTLILRFIETLPVQISRLKDDMDHFSPSTVARPLHQHHHHHHHQQQQQQQYSYQNNFLNPNTTDVTDDSFSSQMAPFTWLLSLIASIYSYQPSEAIKFWDDNLPGLKEFPRKSMPPDHIYSPVWFVTYMKMISSLGMTSQCAQFVFDLLVSTPNTVVNLRSLIQSFYAFRQYLSARALPNQQRANAPPANIKIRLESEYLSILSTLRHLMYSNENVRRLLFTDKTWRCIDLIFALLRYPVSPLLKASFLDTLAVFARSPGISPHLWPYLQESKLLSNIQTELKDVETPMEQYLITPSFLRLLDKLTAHGPSNYSNFLPYLKYLQEDIFLQLDKRKFKNSNERWRMAALSLKIFFRILDEYQPAALTDASSASSSTSSDNTSVDNPAPNKPAPPGSTHIDHNIPAKPALKGHLGHHLMKHFFNESTTLLKQICWIIKEGLSSLITRQSAIPDDQFFELAVFRSLQILHLVLNKEDQYIQAQQASQRPERIIRIYKSLAGDKESILAIAHYINYPRNQKICLLSVKILGLLSKQDDKLVTILTSSSSILSNQLLVGFVEKLESPEETILEDVTTQDPERSRIVLRGPNGDFDMDDDYLESDATNASFFSSASASSLFDDSTLISNQTALFDHDTNLNPASSVRFAIVSLLLETAVFRGFNLAHYLLGFEENKTFDDIDLSSPSCISCLPAVVDLLDSPSLCSTNPVLIEACYQLIYILCSDKRTSVPVLRYLRSSSRQGSTMRFFHRHLVRCSSSFFSDNTRVFELNQRAWLLKTLAIELHVTTPKHRSELLEMLFVPPEAEKDPEEAAFLNDDIELASENSDSQRRVEMLQLLDLIDFPLPEPPIFNDLSNQYRYLNDRGVILIDIQKLEHHLVEEQRNLEMVQPMFARRLRDHDFQARFEEAIKKAKEQNAFSELFGAIMSFFQAWKQILAVSLSRHCFPHLQQLTNDNYWLFHFLDLLLRKLESPKTALPLAQSSSEAILCLMTKLRELTFTDNVGMTDAHYLPIDQLHTILRGILDGIMRHGASQIMRGNLYCTLLNYLKFSRHQSVPSTTSEESAKPQQLAMYSVHHQNQHRAFESGNVRILTLHGWKFWKILCTDAANATDLIRSAAFAALDALTAFDPADHRWLDLLKKNGYFGAFITSLRDSDDQLQLLLTPDSPSLSRLYIYEALMSFLSRIVLHEYGALTLLNESLIDRLNECKFIDQRPDESSPAIINMGGMSPSSGLLLPNNLQRYQQLLSPVLRIITSILMVLPKHQDAARQATNFIMTHKNLIVRIFVDDTAITLASLEVLSLLTSVFYHLIQHPEIFLSSSNSQFHLYILQVFVKFSIPENWLGSLKRSSIPTDQSTEQKASAIVREILRNTIAYLRFLTSISPPGKPLQDPQQLSDLPGPNVASSSSSSSSSFIQLRLLPAESFNLFAPSLESASTKKIPTSELGNFGQKPPSLSVLACYIKDLESQFLSAQPDLTRLQQLFTNVQQLPLDQLAEFSAQGNRSDIPLEEITDQQRQVFAQLHLAHLLSEKEKMIECIEYSLENALWIFWKYLAHFLSSLSLDSSSKDHLRRDAARALSSTLSDLYAHKQSSPSHKSSLLVHLIPHIRNLFPRSSSSFQ